MAPKAKAGAGARGRSTSASAKAAPRAKGKAEPKAKAKAEPKARPEPGAARPGRDPAVERAENLLRECLAEGDVARVDGRVLDIAILDARRLEGLDSELLARSERRLAEYRAFEAELQQRAEELRAQKAEVIARHDEENDTFADAVLSRQRIKKTVEDLFDAVGDGDVDRVRAYTGSTRAGGGDTCFPPPPLPIDVEDHEGNTPLSEAACYGEVEVVELLLASRAHPNARNGQGRTPLFRATYNGHGEVVRFLLEHGADPAIENHSGEPPGKYGTAETKVLLAGWDGTQTAKRQQGLTPLQLLAAPWPRLLLDACSAGDVAAAIAVVGAITANSAGDGSAGLLRSVVGFEDVVDALWMACTKGHTDLCRVLLGARADVDSCSEGGLTCLMIACRKGHSATVQELLAHGAKTHLRSQQGRLACDYAREFGDGHAIHGVVIQHCQKTADWTTLEREALESSGNKACGVEAAERIIEGRRNAGASDAATAALKAMSASELRPDNDRYRDLLEQRALADVVGIG